MSDPAAFGEVSDTLTEELREDWLIDTTEEKGCDEKDEAIPEEVMPAKNVTLNELVKIIHNIEHAKNKMLEADPSFGRIATIHHTMERCPRLILSLMTRRWALFKLFLLRFIQRHKALYQHF